MSILYLYQLNNTWTFLLKVVLVYLLEKKKKKNLILV